MRKVILVVLLISFSFCSYCSYLLKWLKNIEKYWCESKRLFNEFVSIQNIRNKAKELLWNTKVAGGRARRNFWKYRGEIVDPILPFDRVLRGECDVCTWCLVSFFSPIYIIEGSIEDRKLLTFSAEFVGLNKRISPSSLAAFSSSSILLRILPFDSGRCRTLETKQFFSLFLDSWRNQLTLSTNLARVVSFPLSFSNFSAFLCNPVFPPPLWFPQRTYSYDQGIHSSEKLYLYNHMPFESLYPTSQIILG